MISQQELYSQLTYYYDNPEFTKIKNTDDYSIYMCKLNIQIANSYRYLIAIVLRDVFFIGETQKLSQLRWKVFQTRSLSDPHIIIKKRYSYYPKHNEVFNSIITRQSANSKEVSYKSDMIPVTVSLLIDDKNLYEYPEKGTFLAALETFNTVIVLK